MITIADKNLNPVEAKNIYEFNNFMLNLLQKELKEHYGFDFLLGFESAEQQKKIQNNKYASELYNDCLKMIEVNKEIRLKWSIFNKFLLKYKEI